MSKICFITAIYGNYELTCKRFVKQTVDTDFICFTDNGDITANGWIIDTTPYHIINKSPLDNDIQLNSLSKNTHTFNIAKYYKCAFQNVPRLKNYDVVVWLDGTIEIVYDKVSEYILNNIYNNKIIGWHHEWQYGELSKEVNTAKNFYRYSSTYWNNQHQPFQEVAKQYDDYIEDGYTDKYFKDMNHYSPHFGVWITCFVAFLNKDEKIKEFLDLWYSQILKYSTEDQVSFPYVCQKLQLIPLTLPNNEVSGDTPHNGTMFYAKHHHHQ